MPNWRGGLRHPMIKKKKGSQGAWLNGKEEEREEQENAFLHLEWNCQELSFHSLCRRAQSLRSPNGPESKIPVPKPFLPSCCRERRGRKEPQGTSPWDTVTLRNQQIKIQTAYTCIPIALDSTVGSGPVFPHELSLEPR